MDQEKIKQVIEALLFVANHPIPLKELCDIVGESEDDVQKYLDEIKLDLEQRKSALQIAYIAGGIQFATQQGFGYWVKKLYRDQTTFKLSPSALETLSIVAYKQPITRAEVEEIRGVEVSGVLETLFERHLVKVVGRKETVGRPLLYGTTQDFLRHFNLWKISDLPSLEDIAQEAERKSGNELVPIPVFSQPSDELSLETISEISEESNLSELTAESTVELTRQESTLQNENIELNVSSETAESSLSTQSSLEDSIKE